MMKSNAQTIDAYIHTFDGDIIERLMNIRQVIKDSSPQATEKISYQMPTFYLNGNLVHFGAFKNHIGFYPTPSGVSANIEGLDHYQRSKGSIIFPHSKPIPYDIIKKIVELRTIENLNKRKNNVKIDKNILLKITQRGESPFTLVVAINDNDFM